MPPPPSRSLLPPPLKTPRPSSPQKEGKFLSSSSKCDSSVILYCCWNAVLLFNKRRGFTVQLWSASGILSFVLLCYGALIPNGDTDRLYWLVLVWQGWSLWSMQKRKMKTQKESHHQRPPTSTGNPFGLPDLILFWGDLLARKQGSEVCNSWSCSIWMFHCDFLVNCKHNGTDVPFVHQQQQDQFVLCFLSAVRTTNIWDHCVPPGKQPR